MLSGIELFIVGFIILLIGLCTFYFSTYRFRSKPLNIPHSGLKNTTLGITFFLALLFELVYFAYLERQLLIAIVFRYGTKLLEIIPFNDPLAHGISTFIITIIVSILITIVILQHNYRIPRNTRKIIFSFIMSKQFPQIIVPIASLITAIAGLITAIAGLILALKK